MNHPNTINKILSVTMVTPINRGLKGKLKREAIKCFTLVTMVTPINRGLKAEY